MEGERPSVLIVDDEEGIRSLVCEGLTEEGYFCDTASNGDEALAKLERHKFDVALLDIRLPGMSGMDLLEKVERYYQITEIIMMTAIKNIETAVEAMKLGASDYITKPFTLGKLNGSISRVLCSRKQKQHLAVYPIIPDTGNASCDNALLREINAIANGVDAQVDYFDFHLKIVTERTVELAQWLGLPEKEIERWATARYEFYSERDMQIKSVLSKLERNPMAQVI